MAIGIEYVYLIRAIWPSSTWLVSLIQALKVRFPLVHIVDPQRPVIATSSGMNGLVTVTNQVQLLGFA